MGYFFRPLSVCTILVIVALSYEVMYLNNKHSWLTKKIYILITSTLLITSILTFTYFFTETYIDVMIVLGVIFLNLTCMYYTVRILHTEMPLQYIQFLLIHLFVGVLFTGLKEYVLIDYPRLFFTLLMAFSVIYYIYRTNYQFKPWIIALISALIIFRLIGGMSINFEKMDIYSDQSILKYTYGTRATKAGIEYIIQQYPRSRIRSLVVFDSNPRKGIVLLINYSAPLDLDAKIRLVYLNGEIIE